MRGRAWAVTGLAGTEEQSKTLADRRPDEVWKWLLKLAVAQYRFLVEQVEQTETHR